MLENILGQPASLEKVLQRHTVEERPHVDRCADLIRSSLGRIIVTGMGASFFAALPFVQALEAQGRAVYAIESAELLHSGHASWRKQDLVILISRSGASIEVLLLAEKMRDAGATMIGVSNVAGSPLTRLADESLITGSDADQLVAVQTYTGTVLAMLLLADRVADISGSAFEEICRASLPKLESFVQVILSKSDDWKELLRVSHPLYLLGRGAALPTVNEGALLFHETAKAPTIGMSSGQFRHGPVEAVSRDFSAIVIGTPETTRELDWSLANDLRRMGASVRWVGPIPSAGDASLAMVDGWPEVPERLASLFDIIPLQIAAYQMALARGITPGDFRYAPEITAQESGFPMFRMSHP